jgi:hypothetical protein
MDAAKDPRKMSGRPGLARHFHNGRRKSAIFEKRLAPRT